MTLPVEVVEHAVLNDSEEQLFQGLSWSSRVQGYVLFTALGFFSSIMGWVALGIGSYWKYSVLSTLGSVMSLASTFILMGPRAQLQYMFDEYRRTASMLYLGSLLLTWIVAMVYKSAFLCSLCGLLQYACLIWYSLSYVPYGREAVSGFLSRLISYH
ncbi:SFT2 domain containing 2 [Trypanosoma conorhini]|uniref:Vesicle transport protein n=1 Tax=Trypanosoma conorhini TaxID=83891 RepID=A0A3R7L456_9TRYP|nr:SFT2 domain containing 2 [Trypanosoma conorhini]RNF15916.1 SFT2 domain containing 2 [Trypanosoma conorhini]